MKIDEAIKSKFNNERHKLAVNLIYTAGWIASMHHAIIKPHGISLQQHNVLRILRGQKGNPCNLNLIKDRMLDKMSDASRIVVRLSKAGLVECSANPNDRRALNILISPAGLELLAQIDTKLQSMDDTTRALSDLQVDDLNGLLDKLRG